METKPQIKFSLLEKLEFYDDPQIKRFSKIFPNVRPEDVRPYIQLAIDDMEGKIPKDANNWDWRGLPLEALAIQRLIKVLHREASLSDKDEIMEYLMSIHLPKPCCEEVIASIISREIFSNIPKSIRLIPTIASLQWRIDLSFCQRNLEDFKSLENKVSNFHTRSRVILLLQYSNGRKHALSFSVTSLARLRQSLSCAIQSCADVERRSKQPVRLTEEEREALEERGETIQGAI